MQQKNSYILWLPSWYPNVEDPFDGDFIQRHAQAAATENNIHVLFVKAVVQAEEKKEVVNHNGLLTEQIFYIKKEHGLLKKLTRQVVWFQTYVAAVRKLIQEKGLPKLVHVHVPWRAGIIALWIKNKFKTPYLITEHWDIYNAVIVERFTRKPWWMRQVIRTIYRQAHSVVAVSRFIGDAINTYVVPKNYSVIFNVVDTNVFRYKAGKPQPFTFLHVSNMVPKKNVAGILEAFIAFQQTGAHVQLILVGNRDDAYIKYAEALQPDKCSIFFQGEISYAEVAREMQAAHCFVLNSTIENAPCVISEALCCGVPVIATAVGGIPELTDETNSILIPPNDVESLTKAMKKMYEDFKKFNGEQIAATAAARFGVAIIAGQITALYQSIGENR